MPIAMNEKDLELSRDQSAQPLTGTGIFVRALEKDSKRKMAKERIENLISEIFLTACIYDHKRKLRESEGRIAARGSREIYFGHGAPVSNGDGVDNKFK